MIYPTSIPALILFPFLCFIGLPNSETTKAKPFTYLSFGRVDYVKAKLKIMKFDKITAHENTYYNCKNNGDSSLRYIDAQKLNIIGKIKHGGKIFHRLDTSEFPLIPKNVKVLATQSAGLAVSFQTTSSRILAKWCTSPRATASNMTGIAFEGMDLYILRNNRWQFAGVARPESHECEEAMIVENLPSGVKDCLLFLPTYDEIQSLKLGVDRKSIIFPLKNPFHKNILVYGSSIVQGASASRPGLAYPARLSRETGYNFINFGFSGSGKMETEVANMIASMKFDVCILDCVPNPSPEEILERTRNLVLTIRKKHPRVPIIAIHSVAREKGNFDTKIQAKIKLKEQYFNQEIKSLQLKDSALFLIDAKGLLGDDQEGTTDGIHPNDLGFDRMLQKIRPKILDILHRYGI